MATSSPHDDCPGCPGRLVCRCLQITEEALLRVLESEEALTLTDIRQRTGAGDGCTACHRLLRRYLGRSAELAVVQPSSSSPSPI